MKDFTSKLSLYDILSMVIPGGTIFLFLSLAFGNQLSIDQSKISPALGWTIALVISYLLGLINHVCTAMIWRCFRNCPIMLKQSLIKTQQELGDTQHLLRLTDREKKCCKIVHCWMNEVMGIGVPIIVLTIITSHFLNTEILKVLPFILLASISIITSILCLTKNKNDKENQCLLNRYYEAYYFVANHRPNGNISIMEGQVAFLQNMLTPLLLYVFLPKEVFSGIFCLIDLSVLKILLGCGILLMISTVFYRQEKIYRCIWEDYEFLNRLEHEKTDR